MNPREDRERGREGPPQRLAETNPPAYPGTSYDFILQMVFEMQGKLGELTQGIKTLTDDSREHGKELKHIGKVMYAAGVLIPIISVLGMWILGRLWEYVIAPALKLQGH
jgi:hypothetical protein